MNDPIIQKAKDDLEHAEKEISRLESEIASLRSKRAKLSAFLDIYGVKVPSASAPRAIYATPPEPPNQHSWVSVTIDRVMEQTARARISQFVAKQLEKNQPIRTRDLLASLKAAGFEPGGADKIQALSAILSKDERFVADRANGWSLKK